MKSKVLIIIMLMLLLCGCGKQKKTVSKKVTTPDYSKKFNYYTKNLKCSILDEKELMYLGYDVFVTTDGAIYTYVTGDKLYSNEEQCSVVDTNIVLKKHINNSLFLATDKNYYNLLSDGTLKKFNIKEEQTVLKDLEKKDNVKQFDYGHMQKGDAPNYDSWYFHKMYILTDEGNILENIYKYTSSSAWDSYYLYSSKTIYSKEKYEKILQFYMSADRDREGLIDIIVSENGLYYMKRIETEECLKYEDVKCDYEMVPSDSYAAYLNNIYFVGEEFIMLNNYSILRPVSFMQ